MLSGRAIAHGIKESKARAAKNSSRTFGEGRAVDQLAKDRVSVSTTDEHLDTCIVRIASRSMPTIPSRRAAACVASEKVLRERVRVAEGVRDRAAKRHAAEEVEEHAAEEVQSRVAVYGDDLAEERVAGDVQERIAGHAANCIEKGRVEEERVATEQAAERVGEAYIEEERTT
ncbi:hypothetical protein K525DRAFT_273816 [Schizophyllum commune Loenen D]|nr:hypothetical protein K525DRAFT_273816 [Schizophyllum commune Loenen D]